MNTFQWNLNPALKGCNSSEGTGFLPPPHPVLLKKIQVFLSCLEPLARDGTFIWAQSIFLLAGILFGVSCAVTVPVWVSFRGRLQERTMGEHPNMWGSAGWHLNVTHCFSPRHLQCDANTESGALRQNSSNVCSYLWVPKWHLSLLSPSLVPSFQLRLGPKWGSYSYAFKSWFLVLSMGQSTSLKWMICSPLWGCIFNPERTLLTMGTTGHSVFLEGLKSQTTNYATKPLGDCLICLLSGPRACPSVLTPQAEPGWQPSRGWN